MNRPLLTWMICLALAAGLASFTRSARAQESAGVDARPGTAAAAPATTATTATMPMTAAPSPGPVFAPAGPADGLFSRVRPADLVAVVVYALLGLLLGLLGYKVYDWITPFDLRKELEIDQNTSVGIVCGAIILGMCLIVAAAIRG